MDDTFADSNSLKERLCEQLAASTVCEITGIVCPSGVGGGKSRGEDLWELCLSFDGWRVDSGEIRTNYLTVRRWVTDEELREFQASIRPETIVRVRVRLCEESVLGCPQGQLEEIIDLAPQDTELEAYLQELQKPVSYEDERFGTLKFDRSLDRYSAEVEWDAENIELSLDTGEDGELNVALQVAYALWDERSNWDKRVKDYAVQELLPLKNDSWLDLDEVELSPDEFQARMTLTDISVYYDGNFDFWYDDGDLFWGHAIQISGNLSDGLDFAGFSG